MTDKVRISRIEIDGDGYPCRVILSDGKELDGLQRVAPGAIMPNDIMKVQIDAVIGPSDKETS